jgi:hypothetical protein
VLSSPFPVRTGAPFAEIVGLLPLTSNAVFGFKCSSLARIIRDFTGEKRKDALKGVMNTGF